MGQLINLILFLFPLILGAMTNLELKVRLDRESRTLLGERLAPYYAETLEQIDTYFKTREGRLKLREETGGRPYLIRYLRPDLEGAKESSYLFYPIEDANLFLSVVGDAIKEEVRVKKLRVLYHPKPYIRVHLDEVESLGDFLEIEIILSDSVSLETATADMRWLEKWLGLDAFEKVNRGYRELMQEEKFGIRDFTYYKTRNKIFWVIAEDLGHFKRYDIIPCLFVEQFEDGSYGIIQLDPAIADDGYQYTAWRKLLGQEHGFRAEVLLIDAALDKLYTLKGEEVAFDSLSRSSRFIDRSFLAPFSRIN